MTLPSCLSVIAGANMEVLDALQISFSHNCPHTQVPSWGSKSSPLLPQYSLETPKESGGVEIAMPISQLGKPRLREDNLFAEG